ncbi:hypothetical protein AJ79_04433 [Helicocarpus griseus UAMH5409]|uniref:Uncharacterized protein n=1 Tax=Helicocarpus griseus UAMH5409 TaxID=1447875 RepID=A0A2B7XT47_9EURO|nr:hypothetical protein AJ79_04433 [Helicocarpus griseus UAMH5409]
MTRITPEAMALSVIVEANLFTAMRATTFSTYPGDTLLHIVGACLNDARPQGPKGQWSPARLIGNTNSDSSRGIDNQRWTLATDPTITPNYPDWFREHVTEPIKIISPPYYISSVGWKFDMERIFRQVFGRYASIINSGALWVECNTGTCLNVQIGNGANCGADFPFYTVRNLAMVLLVYEPVLDRMVRLNSVLAHPNNPRRWVSSLSSPYFLPPNVPNNCSRAALASHLLGTCFDIPSIVRAMNPSLSSLPDTHNYYKYDFSSLLDSVEESVSVTTQSRGGVANGHTASPSAVQPTRRTVQFRLPENLAVDPEILVHWVKFLGSLIEFANEVDLSTLKETLGITFQNGGTTAAQGNTIVSARPPEFAAPQPPGSLLRLFIAMEQVQIPLDSDTARFWYRRWTRG